MPDPKPEAQERILGHLRIFQSVFNDLNMRHEIVTLADGRQTYAYVYDGTDPYELEDIAFPNTVALIAADKEKAVREARIDELILLGKTYIWNEAVADYLDERVSELQSHQEKEAVDPNKL